MDEQRDDEQIVKQVLDGNSEKFQELVKRYQPQIFNIGLRFFKNETDSFDFVQEVFIKAFQKLNSFKGLSPFRFWLLKIAYNTGISSLKATKNDGSIENVIMFSSEKDPVARHIEDEIRSLVINAVNTLPERYRICVDFYFFYGLAYREISQITGYPVNTIKSHVLRAKKELREALAGTIAEDYYEM